KHLIIMTLAVFCFAACQTVNPLGVTYTGEDAHTTVSLEMTNGETVEVTKVSKGPLGLYTRMVLVEEDNLYDPFFPVLGPDSVAQFYIGGETVERIGMDNFEPIIKREMADATLIVDNLGREGFRYENLWSMVYYYNRLKTESLVEPTVSN
ncbi:MAG: hypothetical protein AAF960_21265, partial [Bacteroidota bacterium]